jgi:hypothetical protein
MKVGVNSEHMDKKFVMPAILGALSSHIIFHHYRHHRDINPYIGSQRSADIGLAGWNDVLSREKTPLLRYVDMYGAALINFRCEDQTEFKASVSGFKAAQAFPQPEMTFVTAPAKITEVPTAIYVKATEAIPKFTLSKEQHAVLGSKAIDIGPFPSFPKMVFFDFKYSVDVAFLNALLTHPLQIQFNGQALKFPKIPASVGEKFVNACKANLPKNWRGMPKI